MIKKDQIVRKDGLPLSDSDVDEAVKAVQESAIELGLDVIVMRDPMTGDVQIYINDPEGTPYGA